MEKGVNGPKLQEVTQTNTIIIPSDKVKSSLTLSPNAEAWTMILDNFDLTLRASEYGSSDSNVRVRTFTYVQKIESAKDTSVKQDFRGYVDLTGNASAAVIIHSGTQTTVVDLMEASQTSTGENIEDTGIQTNYITTISTVVPKGQSLRTTVILLGDPDKGGAESSVSLTLDSIDSEVKYDPEVS